MEMVDALEMIRVLRSSSPRLGISMDRISKVQNSDEMRKEYHAVMHMGRIVAVSCE